MSTGKVGPRTFQRKDPLLSNLLEEDFPFSFIQQCTEISNGYTAACWGEKLLLVMTAVK